MAALKEIPDLHAISSEELECRLKQSGKFVSKDITCIVDQFESLWVRNL